MDDLISRQAAIDAVSNMLRRKFGIGGDLAEITLAELPSAQPERKRGKWKPYRCDMYECSECGYIYTELTDRHRCGANYCPNCGADMREVSE